MYKTHVLGLNETGTYYPPTDTDNLNFSNNIFRFNNSPKRNGNSNNSNTGNGVNRGPLLTLEDMILN